MVSTAASNAAGPSASGCGRLDCWNSRSLARHNALPARSSLSAIPTPSRTAPPTRASCPRVESAARRARWPHPRVDFEGAAYSSHPTQQPTRPADPSSLTRAAPRRNCTTPPPAGAPPEPSTPGGGVSSSPKKRSPHLRDLAGDFRIESRNLDIALRRAHSSCLQPASRNGCAQREGPARKRERFLQHSRRQPRKACPEPMRESASRSQSDYRVRRCCRKVAPWSPRTASSPTMSLVSMRCSASRSRRYSVGRAAFNAARSSRNDQRASPPHRA
jgi:hypothetical protein